MAYRYDLKIDQGATLVLEIECHNDLGQPMDLAGYTAQAQVRYRHSDAAPAAVFSATLTGKPVGNHAFVFSHKGLITANHTDILFGANPSSNPTAQNAFMSSLQANGVRYLFNGHDHNYQHHEFLGVHYIVTGGGGAPLYPVDGSLEGITKKVVMTEHFVRLKVTPTSAAVEAIALDGSVLDAFEVKP